MRIYAIGDLHLSGEPPKKPMDVFGVAWQNHWQKIITNWSDNVAANDIVIICGDTSWAMTLNEALVDLIAINKLPGKKVFIRGNHDFWWSSITKMQQKIPKDCYFIHNNYYTFQDIAICGSRGWLTPNQEDFSNNDEKIYLKELQRTETSLLKAKNSGHKSIILALHYPPVYNDKSPSGFTDLCDKYQVKYCIYGHLHDKGIEFGYQGLFNNTNYQLTSADALNFKLKELNLFS